MLKDITIGQYYPGASILHRLDPRTKINFSILFMISLFIINSMTGYIFFGMITVSLIVISQVPFKLILKGLKPLLIIIIITFFIHLFFTDGGEVLAAFGPMTITEEGLRQGSLMSSRLIFLVMVTSLLTLTTTPISLTDGIEKLLSPLKKVGFSPHELAMMMSIALRFIPTLIEETDKIMKAQTARGADFETGNIIQKAKNIVPLLVPLFVSAFRRADELAVAMEARCYRGGENRTKMKELSFAAKDYISLALGVLILIIAIGIRVSL